MVRWRKFFSIPISIHCSDDGSFCFCLWKHGQKNENTHVHRIIVIYVFYICLKRLFCHGWYVEGSLSKVLVNRNLLKNEGEWLVLVMYCVIKLWAWKMIKTKMTKLECMNDRYVVNWRHCRSEFSMWRVFGVHRWPGLLMLCSVCLFKKKIVVSQEWSVPFGDHDLK